MFIKKAFKKAADKLRENAVEDTTAVGAELLPVAFEALGDLAEELAGRYRLSAKGTWEISLEEREPEA